MTTIGGFINGILDGTIPPEKQNYYLEIVSAEVKRLSKMVNAMLNISRIETGNLNLNIERFDISKKLLNTFLTFEQLITDKNIIIEGLEDLEPINIPGDQSLIDQVVYNLIDNAVKFTSEEGSLSLKVHSTDKKTVVSVYNSGNGIPADDIPRVFDRFYKTDRSRGLDKKGVGLGLYISKTIIDQHGEEMWVKSEEGSYCEFAFTLEKKHK
jgi:signal transduction histidine kinase